MYGYAVPPFSSRPWSGIPLKFDDTALSVFNLIDTTIRIDSIGIIDILIAATPLLYRASIIQYLNGYS